MANIKSFIVPPPDDPAINHPENLEHGKYLSQLLSFSQSKRQLSEEELEALHEAMIPDSIRLIKHFEPKFQAQHAALIQQVEAIEKIAQSAALHADQAVEQTNASKENLALFKEQVESLSSIAQGAKSQAISACKELDIMQQQLAFAKSEAESAKKDAVFAKVTSILAIIISIVIPLLT